MPKFWKTRSRHFSCRIFIVFDKIEQLTIFTPFPNGISQKTHFLLKMTKLDTFLTTSIFVIFTHTILFGVVSGNKNKFSQISRECYFFDKILRHPKKNRMCVIVFFDVYSQLKKTFSKKSKCKSSFAGLQL